MEDKSIGVIYDTAMEEKLRNGKAHPLEVEAFRDYVDTLSEPVAVTRWSDEGGDWDVFVATNRGWFESPGDPEAANTVLDEVQYGRCAVSIPQQRRGTEVKLASDHRGSGRTESIANVESTALTTDEFLDGVNQQLEQSRQRDLLLFVHGFNVPFEAAVTRAAQLGRDIPFNGAIVAYCWPTQGGVMSYYEDEPINSTSVGPFTEFLHTLRSGIPADAKIQIVVHSMGNRIVMEALDRLPRPKRGKPFTNVVLCSPDVGRRDYLKWAPGVVEQSERVTLYANQSDSALIISKGLHAEPRAGDAEYLIVTDGIETIDCSRVDLSFMGHSYYGSNSDMLTDLFQLLKEDKSASRRPHLTKEKSKGGPYWEFARTAGSIRVAWHFDE